MILPSCREVTQTLAEADKDLSWPRRLLFKLHMGMCDHCARFAKQLRLLGNVIRARRPDAASVEALQKKLRDRLTKG